MHAPHLRVYTRACTYLFVFSAVNSSGHPGVTVDLANLHTNILLVDLNPDVIRPEEFCRRMETVSVLYRRGPGYYRILPDTPDTRYRGTAENQSLQIASLATYVVNRTQE